MFRKAPRGPGARSLSCSHPFRTEDDVTESYEHPEAEELVTIARPADVKDTTYYSEAGPLRFLEGRAHGVPLSVARKVAAGRPGWTIEPAPRPRRF